MPDTAAAGPPRPRPPDRRAGRDRFRRAPRRAGSRTRRSTSTSPRSTPRSRTPDAAPLESATAAPPARAGAPPGRRPAPAPARKGGGQRLPDLSALPPLLAATGTFAALRERLGRVPATTRAGPAGTSGSWPSRTAPRATSRRPSPWRPTASGSSGSPATPRSATGWPRSSARGSAIPEAVAILEPRTALAYERSELIADETAARVAALAAWRSGRARVLVAERPGPPPAHDRPGRPAGRAARAAPRRADPPGRAAARAVRPRLRPGHRGGRSRRVRAARRDRRRLPAVAGRCRSGSSSSATRSTRCARSTRPTSGPSARSSGRAPAGVRVPPAGAVARPRSASASVAPRRGSRSAWPPTSPGSTPSRSRRATPVQAPRLARPAPTRRARWRSATPPRSGPPTSPRRPALDHVDPGTLLVLDEPGDIAEAAEFLWRQADERRAELVEAGELPKDWPSTYLPPRDWKTRLVASRTLELHLGVGPARGRRRWPAARCRRATRSAGASRSCRPAGPGRLADARRRRGARTAPGSCSPRTRRPAWPTSWARPAIRSRSSVGSGRRRRPARSRSSSGASTAASSAAPTASSSSPTASCSARSASAGRGPSGGSSRATSSSA